MTSESDFEKEVKALSRRRAYNMLVFCAGASIGIGGGALAAGAFGAFGSAARILGAAGVIVGVATVFNSMKKDVALTKEYIDLQAKKSVEDLTKVLKEQSVKLSPEQEAAIQKKEFEKSQKEWADRIKAEERAAMTGRRSASGI